MLQFLGSSGSPLVIQPVQVVPWNDRSNVDASLFLEDSNVWHDTLLFPAYAAAVSAVVLLAHLVSVSELTKKLDAHVATSDETLYGERLGVSRSAVSRTLYVKRMGGRVIFGFLVARMFSCLILLGLSATTLLLHYKESKTRFSSPDWLQVAVCTTYVYVSLLSFSAVVARPRLGAIVSAHAAFVLLMIWGVFAFRDFWPLATYTLTPLDANEGVLLWVKSCVLTVAAVVIPLGMPRKYVPFDPVEPMPEPSPEQTVPLISMLLFSFLDPVVFLAYRVSHLSFDQFPVLPDYSFAKNFVQRRYPLLDPFRSKNKRHLFWNILSSYRYDFMKMGVTVFIGTAAKFAAPIGINRLLDYIETGGKDTIVQPWVWVLWLFFGPLTATLGFQWYTYLSSLLLVDVTAVLTQLAYDHALRVRMTARTSESPSNSNSRLSTAVATPYPASIAETEQDRVSPSDSVDTDASTTAASVGTQSANGKQKARARFEGEKAETDDRGRNLVGRINNLVTSDVSNITGGRDLFVPFVVVPFECILSVAFLYAILGWSAFVGVGVTLALFPVPGYIVSQLHQVQAATMETTDARVQTVTETMAVIRMIKLFGWEPRMAERIAEKREDELQKQRKGKVLELLNGNINFVIPLVTMAVTYMTYTTIMKKELTASRVYSSMAVFEMVRESLQNVFGYLPELIQAKVSLDRFNEFLHKTELLDEFTEKADAETADLLLPKPDFPRDVIGFRDASFTWSNESTGALTPGSRTTMFTLRIEEELLLKRGQINLIVGPTGSGKTSMLMALLGELHYIPTSPDSFFNLPRDGGVAYAAQESWVQSETIRDNIVFGARFDQERYNKVIEQCCLQRDLSLFEAGDKTEVGEKGLTLSGGQKARITLARAVYSSADVLLLDDILAALDVHTARWIVEKCLVGDLVRGRTVILVTHNVAMASPIADFVVSIGSNGRVLSQGSLSKALASNYKLSLELFKESDTDDKVHDEEDIPTPDATKGTGKLVAKEEISIGTVGWSAYKMYLENLGGKRSFLFWILFLGGYILCETSNTIQVWWLGYWASQYEDHVSSEVSVSYYLGAYGLMLAFAVVVYCIGYTTYIYGTLRASRNIHKTLINSVLGTTLRWLDVTPTSRIIARCTQDIQAVDRRIATYIDVVLKLTLTMLLKFVGVIAVSPVFVFPGIIVAVLGAWCGRIYMAGQLSVQREMSNARSPVLEHFSAAITGLISIRAYGAQDVFKQESYKRIDNYSRAVRTINDFNRWVSIRIDALGGLFAASLAAYLIYFTDIQASNTGFSLTMAVTFSATILWWVRRVNGFQISANSLERIQQYITIEQEAKPTESGVPPAYWPASGELKVEKLSARYSSDSPEILNDISFEVKPGERVGIVGRTGSGKSSLTLALLRCILTEGKVYYDGIPTDSLNLDALRAHITIIPQVPELLSGTLRQNLDPFSEYDDAVLNEALRSAGLFSIQDLTEESRITLDSQISSGGGNLSVGQRQILALARAIVRQSKLLILDEATSAIDYETDTVIQKSLREQLNKDVSLLTVAHRLQTIMDADRIMVLDAGRIVEYDRPSILLKNQKGLLRALVDESGDKEVLYAMAENAA